MVDQVVGTSGFVAWFYAIIYNRFRKAYKNLIVKIFVHILGLILMISGSYLLIVTMPSITIIMGIFLGLIGLVIFMTPIGVK